MAAGRNCFIISFPYFFTIAAFVLTVFVIIGSIVNNSFLTKLYFMRLNVSDLSLTVDGTTYTASSVNADFPDFYQVGLWGYCEGTIADKVYTVTSCTKTKGLFYFNPVAIFENALSLSNIDLPTAVTNALKNAKIISYAMSILYCLSAVFTFMEFISGFFTFHSRGGSFCTMIISFISVVCIIVSSALATALYYVESKAFNDATSSLDTSSSINKTTYAISWGAVVAALLSTVFWFFSICCGSTSRRTQANIIYHPVENPALMRQV